MQRKALINVTIICLVLGIVAFAIHLTISDKKPELSIPIKTTIEIPAAPKNDQDVCKYWTPWQEVLWPSSPNKILADLLQRVRTGFSYTDSYKQWSKSQPKSAEHICVTGLQTEGKLVIDLVPNPTSCQPGGTFLDYAVEIRVQPGQAANINYLHLTVNADQFSLAKLKAFTKAQTELLNTGYDKWRTAFPYLAQIEDSGLAIAHQLSDAGKSSKLVTISSKWDPQRFWQAFPRLASWLLGLGPLVTINSEITVNDVQLAKSRSSTGDLRSILELPIPLQGLDLETTTPQKILVSHNVSINFKGLIIDVGDINFLGELRSDQKTMSYQGKFMGVGDVEISGSYKGITAFDLDKTIKEFVKTEINRETTAIMQGNGGEGWQIAFGLGPANSRDAKQLLNLTMEFESTMNLVETFRYKAEEQSGLVLPGNGEHKELGNYSEAVILSLVKDAERKHCDIN